MNVLRALHEKHLDRWLTGWTREVARRTVQRALRPAHDGPRDLIFAVCDHYEPLWGDAGVALGARRVRAWHERYPRLAERHRDSDGRPPRHTFFFPGEQYRWRYLELLADLARRGLGEVEVHLHHGGDTAATLERQLRETLGRFAQHGHLSRTEDGRPRYAFIHGNWALANARRDGRHCGVDEELAILFETGCYADFTFPAAPDECQPNVVNQIYWPGDDLWSKRCYVVGKRARVGRVLRDRPLLVQGPLALAKRPGRLALRIESAELRANDPPSSARVRCWVEQGVHVAGRPEWVFVKAFTHGAPEREADAFLGEAGDALHRILTSEYADGKRWRLHYVTAREMYNIAVAAMAGASGNPNDHRDHVLAPPPVATADASSQSGLSA